MKDPLTSLTDKFLIQDYLDLTVQLERGTGTRPVLWLLKDAKDRAADAIKALIEVDAADHNSIRTLQNEIVVYRDMVDSCRKLIGRGRETDRELEESDRAELAEIITPEEAQELGLHTNED